jgi:hypothetical protein
MFTGYWTEKLFGKDYSDFLDFDKRKDSLCNPDNPVGFGDNEYDEGSVISCVSGNCIPVLTFATERTELQYPNDTKYNGSTYNIYTVVYYIAGSDLQNKDISYNVYFKGGDLTFKGYRKEVPLQSYKIKQIKKVFKSKRILTEMCIDFTEPFPVGNSILSQKSFCRPIVETGAFTMGSPWTPEEEEASDEWIAEYDEDGNVINKRRANAGEKDEGPPGVLEG